jgi:hypothetical protein
MISSYGEDEPLARKMLAALDHETVTSIFG